jgi:glycosyltransferase involved in cell wall biosynthesis
MPSISVILPVFNGGAFLIKSLQSVLNQDFKDFEFIICDDCSQDSSYQNIINLTSNYSNVIVLKNEMNLGLFKTLNKLIKVSNSDLVHLWSQDDIMKPNCLSATVYFHKQHESISMSYCSVDYINESDDVVEYEKADNTPTMIDSNLYNKISCNWGCIAGNIANVTLVRKYVVEVNYFNEDLIVSGDYEMWTKLVRKADIGFNNRSLIYLRRHSNQLSRSYLSIFLRMKEDIPIILDILKNAVVREKKMLTKPWIWRTQVFYFNDILFLLSRRQFNLARKCIETLKNHNIDILKLSIRWIIVKQSLLLKRLFKFTG